MDWTSFTTDAALVELMLADKTDRLHTPTRGEIKEFTALALTDAIPLSKERFQQYLKNESFGDSAKSRISRFILKAYIYADINGDPLLPEENPHRIHDNPCNSGTTGDVNEAMKRLIPFTTFISAKDFALTDGDESSIRKNDSIKVLVTLDEDGLIESETGEIIALESRAGDNIIIKDLCVSLSGLFDASTAGTEYDYDKASKATASTGAVDFYKLLREDFLPEDYCDSFVVGLVANAQAESSFVAAANGDPRETVGGNSDQAIKVKGKYYCSFGYWQLNVCSGGGELFAKKQGITDIVNNKEKLYKLITDSKTQIKYMVEHMKDLFGTDVKNCSLSAEYWGQRIAVEFERCSHCYAPDSGKDATSTITRGSIAKDLYGKI